MHIKTMAVHLHTLSQQFMVRAPNHSSLFPAPSGEEVERGWGGTELVRMCSHHDCMPDIQAQSHAANYIMQRLLIRTVQHILSGGSNEGGMGQACSMYREQNAQMVWWGYLKQCNILVELAMNGRISKWILK